MLEVFKYTERVFNMVRPRKLLMIAVGECMDIILRLFAYKNYYLSMY